MSEQKKKRKKFTVQVEIKVWLDTEVLAYDLEDALAQGRELKPRDVIEYEGCANDEEIKIVGVF